MLTKKKQTSFMRQHS